MPHPLTIRNLSYWLTTVGVLYYYALLPFQPTFLPASAGMMIAGVGWLMMIIFHWRDTSISRGTLTMYLLLVLYYLSGISASNDPKYLEVIRIQIPLLFWGLPFVAYYPEFKQKIIPLIVRVFVLSAVISALIFIGYYLFIEIVNTAVEYSKRSPYYFLPVHYLGMYYNAALAILLWGDVTKNQRLLVAAVGILSIAVLMLSARMQWVIFFLLILWYLISAFFQKKIKRHSYFIWLILGVLLALFQIPEIKRRVYETYDEFRSIKTKKNDKQTNHRKFIWREAVFLLKEVPALGYKPGTADRLLMERLSELDEEFWDGEGVYLLRDGNYNFHNQFLQAAAERGLGAVWLIGAMLLIIFYAPNNAARYFVLVITLSMITESILQRQAGVFLVASFFPLMMVLTSSKKEVSNH